MDSGFVSITASISFIANDSTILACFTLLLEPENFKGCALIDSPTRAGFWIHTKSTRFLHALRVFKLGWTPRKFSISKIE